MNNNEEKIQKLLSLKRYETPRDGYFEDFLEEFQQRQRGELRQKSSTSLFCERVSIWFREIGSMKWVAGAGAAYAALMVGIFFWPAGPGTTPHLNRAPASFERIQSPIVTPPPVQEQKDELEKQF